MTGRSVLILSALLFATTLPAQARQPAAASAAPAAAQPAPAAGVSSPAPESSCALSAILQAPLSSPAQASTGRCACGDAACSGQLVGSSCGQFRVCLATGGPCTSIVQKYCACITQDPPPPGKSAAEARSKPSPQNVDKALCCSECEERYQECYAGGGQNNCGGDHACCDATIHCYSFCTPAC